MQPTQTNKTAKRPPPLAHLADVILKKMQPESLLGIPVYAKNQEENDAIYYTTHDIEAPARLSLKYYSGTCSMVATKADQLISINPGPLAIKINKT